MESAVSWKPVSTAPPPARNSTDRLAAWKENLKRLLHFYFCENVSQCITFEGVIWAPTSYQYLCCLSIALAVSICIFCWSFNVLVGPGQVCEIVKVWKWQRVGWAHLPITPEQVVWLRTVKSWQNRLDAGNLLTTATCRLSYGIWQKWPTNVWVKIWLI